MLRKKIPVSKSADWALMPTHKQKNGAKDFKVKIYFPTDDSPAVLYVNRQELAADVKKLGYLSVKIAQYPDMEIRIPRERYKNQEKHEDFISFVAYEHNIFFSNGKCAAKAPSVSSPSKFFRPAPALSAAPVRTKIKPLMGPGK